MECLSLTVIGFDGFAVAAVTAFTVVVAAGFTVVVLAALTEPAEPTEPIALTELREPAGCGGGCGGETTGLVEKK